MYQQYWGLRESPFRGSLDVAQFFATPNHDEALARLHFLVDGRRRLGLVAGKFGIGKSLLLEFFPSVFITIRAKLPGSACWVSTRTRCSGRWRLSLGSTPRPLTHLLYCGAAWRIFWPATGTKIGRY